jgi:general secretion pathway protein G
MDCYPFVNRPGEKTRDCPGKSVLDKWRRRIAGGRIDAFTLIELIVIIAIVGVLAGIAAPIYADFRYKAQVKTAKAIITEIENAVTVYYYRYGSYPATLDDAMAATPLDPWGNPYVYVSSQDPNWNSLYRFDRNMIPINSDFDLYSKGADGQTARPLTAQASWDDIIRGGNGSFTGLGRDF